jgi:hypothetical protein
VYFKGIGYISYQGKDIFQYRVTCIKDLYIIINHFNNYPLLTQSWFLFLKTGYK